MPPHRISGTTDVQDARNALGQRLRELRQRADLNGRQLAESLAWPPSKVSKLENGRQTPTDDDIRDWTRATDGAAEVENLLAALHTLEERHAEWQRIFRTGLRHLQVKLAERDEKVRLFRSFSPMVVPGLLQTAEYARSRLAQATWLFDVPDDVDEAVRGRIRRQEILYRPDKRFHFVLTEAALRLRLCPPEAMLGQLDRLISLAALPTVRLGIIGFQTPYVIGPWHGFWLFDQDQVEVETYSAGLTLAQPQEIETYTTVFDSLASIASYGRAARAIITRVIDDLVPELPEDVE